ncbi:MAG: Rieske (2Fe-2S) protein [Thermoguttaceae bacterium]|jgi:Rieske Fe-S protein
MTEPLPRRNVLVYWLETAVAATVAALFYPVVRFLWPRPATSSGALEAIAPFRANELKPNPDGTWPSRFTFNFGGKPCLVVRTRDGQIKAFNAVCTHVECTVEFREPTGDIFCNCHNGLYDLNGHNVSGPPPRPLEVYKLDLRGKPGEEEIVVSRNA